ncbi:unnamed protein product [Lactuca virosa]|uniref:Uncharacterized protein n=1 Tax=Lactuca virosa TaxID=75947 RepID=A0AAU9MAT6_9ASTR|nr:unnamed protein product [Lactuca virosa]
MGSESAKGVLLRSVAGQQEHNRGCCPVIWPGNSSFSCGVCLAESKNYGEKHTLQRVFMVANEQDEGKIGLLVSWFQLPLRKELQTRFFCV